MIAHKTSQIKVSKKTIFASILELSPKRIFTLNKGWVENSVSPFQHVGNGKVFFDMTPLIKLILLHTVVVCQNAQKCYKSSLVTTFVQTCSLISIYNGMLQFVVMMHLSEQVRLAEE